MRLSKTSAFRCCVFSVASILAAAASTADEPLSGVVIQQFHSTNSDCYAIALPSPFSESHESIERHVLLIDTSASQLGTVRDSTLEVTSRVLANLPPRSHVQIIAVDTSVDSLTDGMVGIASREVNDALNNLSLRTPLGTADLRAALKLVVTIAREAKATSVLYIGDGLATSGLISNNDMLATVDAFVAGRISIHSLVLGPKNSPHLPAVLANLTGGTVQVFKTGSEKSTAAQLSAALQIAPVQISRMAVDGKALQLVSQRPVFVRTDRHSMVLGRGKLGEFRDLSISAGQSTQTFPGRKCQRLSSNVGLVRVVEQVAESNGLNAPYASLAMFDQACQAFTTRLAQFDRAEDLLVRRGRFAEARRVRGILTAMQAENLPAPPPNGGNPFANPDDAVPAPAPGPAGADDGLPLAAPAPAAGGFGDDPIPEPTPAASPPIQEFTKPLGGDVTDAPDPISEVAEEVRLQTQILTAETNAAIDEANRLSFDQPEYATNLLKDILETVQSSADISPDIRTELERRVVNALSGIRNQAEINSLRSKQIAQDEAVQEAQRKVLAEAELDERRIGILIDQVRGLLDRARKGDINGFEDAETVSRAALDLKPGNGPSTQALVMSESLGQLSKAYNLVNLRHDRFLEVLYQVELSHVPFPDEPPIQYPPPDVWRALTLVRKPRYESFDLRSEKPVEKWLRQMLDKPVPRLDYPGDTPLSEVMDQISTYFNTTYGELEGKPLRMTVWPDISELDLEGITSLEDVTVRDINFEGITLRNALQLIFDQTIEPELTYVIQNEVFMVTTLAKAESDDNLVTRVYPVADLVIPPVQLGGQGGQGGLGGGGQGGQGGGFGGGGQGGGGFGGGGQGGGGFGGGGGFSIPPEVFQLLEESDQGISNEDLSLKKKPAIM